MAEVGNKVYVPQRVNVQMPATEDNPNGYVRTLNQGWVELDEELANHPVISQLRPESSAARDRADRLLDAERRRDEAIAAAHSEYHAALAESQDDEREEYNTLSEERAGRYEEADRRGLVYREDHPDPAARRAIALTAPPSGHTVSSAALAQKEDEDDRGLETGPQPSRGGRRIKRERMEEPVAADTGNSDDPNYEDDGQGGRRRKSQS